MKLLHPSMNLLYSLFFALFLASNSTAETIETDPVKHTRLSTYGYYNVTIESRLKPLLIGRMHAWTATIRTSDGNPVTNAKIKVGGGMPIHNHSFPTEPEVTKQLEDGIYLIEGIKFSMSGPWVLFLNITSGETIDNVAFDIDL